MESNYESQAAELLDRCLSELLALLESNQGWEEIGTKDGVRGYQRSTPEGKQLIRSIGTIPRSVEEIAAFILDNSKKKSWDGMCIESRNVKVFNETFKIVYERFSAPWPVSHRDFVFASRKFERPDGAILVGKSIDAGVPEERGVVRGEVITSGFYLKRIDQNTTEMTYLVAVDPKGSLPGFVVNKLGKNQCANVNKIRHVITKTN